ncbi:hypothetical protein NP493_1421g00005 [Ridgeia piscesae]|uniref:SEA domain-containing protein n=1 Tax=Ridgeia piscesae TaxID=27915 RepID=A0AAD9K3P0_RIDPI|nr:hypothetical protein NP493_1421g00005 [Ridgeia piscesae]
MELKNGIFTASLTDKATNDYTTLKLTVVNALEKILDTTHGKGTYAIVDVDFRQGSIVVIYGMEITKAAAADTVKYVSSGISKNKGTFVGYTVDVNSLKWAGSASLIVTLSSLTMTCHDSHKPVALLFTSEEPSVVSPGSSHPMTNSGSICSTGEESPPPAALPTEPSPPCLNIHQ